MGEEEKKDVPLNNDLQAAPVMPPVASPATQPKLNVFTSGGVRGSFESVRPTVGRTANGNPVYEGQGQGYTDGKRPPLNTATEQLQAPLLSYQTPQVPDIAKENREQMLRSTPRLNVPEFKAEKTKRDGGFLNWLGGLFKKRQGQREGETDQEYDDRMTKNQMRMAVLADAIRHMGNLYFTSKGGVPQTFNSPSAEIEARYEKRKAERKAQAALAASQAQKLWEMQLKQDAANTDKAYKNMSLYYKGRDADRGDARLAFEKDKDAWYRKRMGDNDAWEHGFKEKQEENTNKYRKGQLALGADRNKAAWVRAMNTGKGSGSGSGNVSTLASPKGSLTRKKDLSATEENQIWDRMKKLGLITKSYLDNYNSLLSPQERREAIRHAIAYAVNSPSKEAAKLREYMKKHHNFTESASSAVGGLDFTGGDDW